MRDAAYCISNIAIYAWFGVSHLSLSGYIVCVNVVSSGHMVWTLAGLLRMCFGWLTVWTQMSNGGKAQGMSTRWAPLLPPPIRHSFFLSNRTALIDDGQLNWLVTA